MHAPDDPSGGAASDAASDGAGSSSRVDVADEETWMTAHGGHYLLRYDRTEDDVASLLVLAFEEITGRDATELPALSDCVDPDALNALFSAGRTHAPPNGSIHFRYHGHDVSIHSDGEILISPRDGEP